MSNQLAPTILWDGKRYHSLSYHLRKKFGGKVFKIPLDAGFTCPNRDGTLGTGGCLFCSPKGSGDFAGSRNLTIPQQFEKIKTMMHRKWREGSYIAYFQAFSNTYADVTHLNELYSQAVKQPGVVGLAIATRPDCLPEEVLDLLSILNERIYLWVELGLQTIHPRTAHNLNLGYDYEQFYQALTKLRRLNIETVAHIILGLPGENRADMLATSEVVANLDLQGIKIHLLHLMQGTGLVKLYEQNKLRFLEKDEYINLVVDILEKLPKDMIIHRLTGDSPRELLIGPEWSLHKWEVLNAIDHEMAKRNTWQGKYQ